MKIVKRKVFEGYEVECNNCGATLQAKLGEMTPVAKTCKGPRFAFCCPNCKMIATVCFKDLRRVTIRENV